MLRGGCQTRDLTPREKCPRKDDGLSFEDLPQPRRDSGPFPEDGGGKEYPSIAIGGGEGNNLDNHPSGLEISIAPLSFRSKLQSLFLDN
ncbi:hypothetical protein MLD38_035364 [Melastoma candidum]|uniref:Uncharacterized protein n=1 Tax=Melastoma candidum TaxID=119954 RepID=A0ACB9LFZ3_9MYRT|nr:hypothetical protein MLD38_035364 [Melastoma candidum]